MKKIKSFYSDNKGVLYGTGNNPKQEFIQNQIANEVMQKKKQQTKKPKRNQKTLK